MSPIEPPDADDPMLPADVFAGSAALVTGGGSGIGLATAKAFARCGAKVAIVGRDEVRLADAAAVLRGLGAIVTTASADVRRPEQIKAAFDQIESQIGLVDILANNAGSNFPVKAEGLSPNGWKAIVEIALNGTFFCCQEFHRRLKAHGRGGVVVNNLASYAWTGLPGGVHSAAAKAGAANVTMTLATEWAREGFRVNGISFGTYAHAGVVHFDPGLPEGARGKSIPARRALREQEIGWAAAFLCSPFAANVTGQVLVLDGGDALRRGPVKPTFTPIEAREALWLD